MERNLGREAEAEAGVSTQDGEEWAPGAKLWLEPTLGREALPGLAQPDHLSEKHYWSQRARGIYGLVVCVPWSWKESQRFYGPVASKKVFKGDNPLRKKKVQHRIKTL